MAGCGFGSEELREVPGLQCAAVFFLGPIERPFVYLTWHLDLGA